LRLAVLFIMTLAAGKIAARGIYLYMGALGHHHGGAQNPSETTPIPVTVGQSAELSSKPGGPQ
jgi:hypothetical protein